MLAEHSDQIDCQREIFLAALSVTTSGQAAYLDQACGEDTILRAAVEDLLAHHIDDSFLAEPAVNQPNQALSETVGTQVGRYHLVEEIGRGGMGVVFRAEQEEPVKRQVALKVIKAGMDTEEVIARFEAERQALAMMDHPNIARIIDAGATESRRPYFVMELVKGTPVTRFCNEHTLNTRQRLELFTDICAAVQHAHQKGIIHRDLKPNNVLVTMQDGSPVPKVIDFGIAKATEGKLTDRTLLTRLHPFIGTPAYMSPEQARIDGTDVDTRTDIYALGVLLYELLTGTTPFDARQFQSAGQEGMFRIIRDEVPPKPSTRITEICKRASAGSEIRVPNSHIDQDLDWIVLKALEKERQRRYETANALALDVQRFLKEEPITAAAPSTLYKFRKFVRRNRGATLAVTAIAASLVLGLGLALLSNVRERKARRMAENQRYASDMKGALAAATSYDRKLLTSILRAHVPEGGDPDRRGWLWRYLHGLSRQEVRTANLDGPSIALATSPDGKWIALSGKRARVFRIDILDIETLSVSQVLEHPGDWLPGMRFSQDSASLMVEPAEHAPALSYDLSSGEHVELSVGNGWNQRLTSDGRYVIRLEGLAAHGRGRHELHCRDANEPVRVRAKTEQFEMPTHSGMENKFRLSPDGALAAVACVDPDTKLPMVKLFAIPELEEAGTIAPPAEVWAIAWSPDSGTLATGYGYPHQVDLWSVRNGETDHVRTLQELMRSPCVQLSFSPNGSLLASTELSGLIHIWDVPRATARRIYSGDPGYSAFSPDGNELVTVSNGSLKVWDSRPPPLSELRRLSLELKLWNVAYSPDGTLLATSAADSVVRVFDARTELMMRELGEPRRDMRKPVIGNPNAGVRFSQDGDTLAVANTDNTASVYDVKTGERRFDLDHQARIRELSISPDGKLLATVGNHADAMFWNAATGEEAFRLGDGGHWLRSVAFSPDPKSRLLAFGHGGGKGNLTLTHLDTRERRAVTTSGSCGSLTFSPDGKWLACGMNFRVELYDVATLTLVETINGASGPVPNVSFSPDGTTLAIPCWGGYVQLWNLIVRAEVGRLNPSPKEASWLISAEFSPDGNSLAVSTRNYGVQVYKTPSP